MPQNARPVTVLPQRPAKEYTTLPDKNVQPEPATEPNKPSPTKRRWWRRPLITILLLLAFLVSWLTVVRVTSSSRRIQLFSNEPPAANETANQNSLTIVTWNIAHGRGPTSSNLDGGSPSEREDRLNKIASLLKSLEPDVVVLNEVDFDSFWSSGLNQAAYLSQRIPLPYRMEQRNLDAALPGMALRFGNAILSRFPIQTATPIEYPDYAKWESLLAGKKQGAICKIALPSGDSVSIVPIHLESRSRPVRIASMQQLLALTRNYHNAILAGDFNSIRIGFAQEQSHPNIQTAITLIDSDPRWKTGPNITNAPSDFTYPSMDPTIVIDWIYTTDSWTFKDYRVIQTNLSDHNLVVATLTN